MKRYIHSSEAYNYSRFVIQFDYDGWCIYEAGDRIAGSFQTWIEAQDYIDETLD